MTSTTIVRPSNPTLRYALKLAAGFAVARLLFQFALTIWSNHLGYGYFRDEFYYIACGRHLAWGYVDHGPIVALQARIGELLFGDSVFAIRILSAVAGALTIFLTGILAWALGGRRPAQALAMFGLFISPQFIGTDGYLSMNSWEAVFWMACALALILMLRGRWSERAWIFFGICAGIGLLNKPSMTFFLIALGLGLLCTSARRILFTRWAALGIALMVLVALPNVLWQAHNHWPTLEFLRNGAKHGKNILLNPLQFFLAQFGNMHPVNSLLWITGIVALVRQRSIKNMRWLGLTFLFFYVLMELLHAKDYYLQGIYPAMFAAGGIAWEHRFSNSPSVMRGRIFAFPLFESLLFITGLLILPMSSPVLSPEAWVRYTTAMHLHGDKMETMSTGPLPQFYADRFGWNEQVDGVLTAWHSLSPAEQKRVCIFGTDYGEAGAVDLLGHMRESALPPALSGQNNYWLWGTHGCDTSLVIAIISDTPAEVGEKFASVQIVPHADNPWEMPFERHRTIYILRNRHPSAVFNWEDERFYF
jgi:hypothetical protein